jgi:hypothetical protein
LDPSAKQALRRFRDFWPSVLNAGLGAKTYHDTENFLGEAAWAGYSTALGRLDGPETKNQNLISFVPLPGRKGRLKPFIQQEIQDEIIAPGRDPDACRFQQRS